jgi:hypothetical protein
MGDDNTPPLQGVGAAVGSWLLVVRGTIVLDDKMKEKWCHCCFDGCRADSGRQRTGPYYHCLQDILQLIITTAGCPAIVQEKA